MIMILAIFHCLGKYAFFRESLKMRLRVGMMDSPRTTRIFYGMPSGPGAEPKFTLFNAVLI